MSELGNGAVHQPEALVTPTGETEQGKNTVAYETHKRLLEQKKAQDAKLAEFEAREKEREEADARKRGDYEALLKSREDALKETQSKLSNLESALTKAEKKNAVLDALGGNIDPKWHRLIDVSEIAFHPETGEVDNLSVAKVAEAFKREFPEAIKRQGNLPPQAPQGLEGGGGKISRAAWLALPSKEMSKWKPHQIVE